MQSSWWLEDDDDDDDDDYSDFLELDSMELEHMPRMRFGLGGYIGVCQANVSQTFQLSG